MITMSKMNAIAKIKYDYLEQLNVLRKNYLITIYRGFCKKESVKQIHKRLLDETLINLHEKYAINDNLLKYAKQLTKKAQSLVKQKELNVFAPILFKFISSGKVFNDMSKIMHDGARQKEADLKNKVIKETIDINRSFKIPKIFYLASEHDDCAEDHEDWQGKIYVDEKWKSLINDAEQKKQIEKFIKAHNIKTFQWVIGKPVWFITRPNCRHFFKEFEASVVLNNSKERLIKIYNLHKAVGDRKYIQTIRHDTRQEWYKEQNVKNIIRQYEDRLNFHKRLKYVFNIPNINYAITKDKLLINKWKQFYKQNFLV